MRRAVLILACALLLGCASRPSGVLAPVAESVPGASDVHLLAVTTREPTDDRGVLFTGERGSNVSLTAFNVSIPPDERRQVGQVQWPRRLPPNPATDFAILDAAPLSGVPAATSWLKDNLPRTRRVVIFVHGFNNRFEDAVYRFAQITHDSHMEAAPVLFTWPSRASVFAYAFDRESTIVSRDAFEETVCRIANDPAVGEVTVMAHSMGAWLAMEGLRQMAIRRGKLPAKITNVILASPDLDVDVFAAQWRALPQPQPRFTVFVSQDDRALALSRRIAGGVDRLGQIDPQSAAYYEKLERSGVVVIDLTAMRSGDRLNHGRFAESPEVVQLIGTRLVAGQTVTDSDPTLGERIGIAAMGVGQTVGGAAAAAVTAPIAIVDPNTRRTYEQQVNEVSRAAGSTLKPQPTQ